MSAPPKEQRLIRHALVDRIFHWIVAATMFTLLGTGLLPVVGIKFAWVTAHWIAGIVLVAALLFHIVRALFWQNLVTMWIGLNDLREFWVSIPDLLGRGSSKSGEPGKPGKYSLAQKLYHHTISLIILVASGTGLAMMVKIDTPFWERDPYWLSPETWGVIYVAHGLSALCLVTMIMLHIYFAFRPEKLWYTRSMMKGWMTRREYLENHDPSRWQAAETDQ